MNYDEELEAHHQTIPLESHPSTGGVPLRGLTVINGLTRKMNDYQKVTLVYFGGMPFLYFAMILPVVKFDNVNPDLLNATARLTLLVLRAVHIYYILPLDIDSRLHLHGMRSN